MGKVAAGLKFQLDKTRAWATRTTIEIFVLAYLVLSIIFENVGDKKIDIVNLLQLGNRQYHFDLICKFQLNKKETEFIISFHC